MIKVSKPDRKFDDDLTEQGKKRVQFPETTVTEDGRWCLAYREKITENRPAQEILAWFDLAKSHVTDTETQQL